MFDIAFQTNTSAAWLLLFWQGRAVKGLTQLLPRTLHTDMHLAVGFDEIVACIRCSDSCEVHSDAICAWRMGSLAEAGSWSGLTGLPEFFCRRVACGWLLVSTCQHLDQYGCSDSNLHQQTFFPGSGFAAVTDTPAADDQSSRLRPEQHCLSNSSLKAKQSGPCFNVDHRRRKPHWRSQLDLAGPCCCPAGHHVAPNA